jgi:hypothetical protein
VSARQGQEPGSRIGVVVPVTAAQEPAVQAPVARAPRRTSSRDQMLPFTTGVLAAGVAVGGPASVVSGVLDGQFGALAFPAAVVAVGWQWWRCEGWDGVRRDLAQPLLGRGELGQAAAGAAITLGALAWVFGGGVR